MVTNFQKSLSLLEIISRYNLIEASFDCVINPLLTRNNNQTIIIVILIDRSDRFSYPRENFNLFNERDSTKIHREMTNSNEM